ncbi:MAG: HpcH/HpaI aldolase/citrate lyase family protein [Hyphomicrobiaceae bacterium]
MRSLLFVPGDSERKLAKAAASGADALILDLEDSVAPDRKTAARETTAAFLASGDRTSSPRLCVRINGLDTDHWQHDLNAVVPGRPDMIMLPKARGGADVQTISAALDALETPETKLIVLATEVPVSLLRLETYVGASPRLEALTWGAEDLSVELGATANRDEAGRFTSPYQMARNLCLVTAAAAGVAAIDTVFTNFRDETGLVREAAEAARDGFTGKLAIHPAQIAPINAAFTPSPDEIARAKAILAAFAAAEPGTGVTSLDGEMLDEPHRRQAERLLARST